MQKFSTPYTLKLMCSRFKLHEYGYYFYKVLYTGVSDRMLIKCSAIIIIF